MRFLEQNEIEDWCAEHGFLVEARGACLLPPIIVLDRATFANGRRSGREATFATNYAARLPTWAECLLWVVQWGVWPSSEDWPKYYQARGLRLERRSLEAAPGQLFAADEREELVRFLTLVMENGWDAQVLPDGETRSESKTLFVSHDGWLELRNGFRT